MNNMKSQEFLPTTVYFDGLCRLCSREIEHYRKQPGADRLRFVDITRPEFDAAQEGVDPHQVHRVMHVRRPDGTLALGVDAFIAIWAVLPRYRWAGKLANRAGVRAGLDVGYWAFAKVRPWLPRKTRDCETSPYCEVKNA